MDVAPLLFCKKPLKSTIFPTFRLNNSFFKFRQDFYWSLAKCNVNYLPYTDHNWERADLNAMQHWCLRQLLFQCLCDQSKGKALLNGLGPGDNDYLDFPNWSESLNKLFDGFSKDYWKNMEDINYEGLPELFLIK